VTVIDRQGTKEVGGLEVHQAVRRLVATAVVGTTVTATVVVLAAISATRVVWATMVADVAAAVDLNDVARRRRAAEVAMIDVVHRDVAHRHRVAAEVAIGMTVVMEVIAVEEEEPMQIVVLTGGQQIRDQGQHRRVAAEIRR